MRACSLLSLCAVALAACMQAGDETATKSSESAVVTPDPVVVQHAIETANQNAIAAVLRGDAAGMIENYAAEAVVMMPNEQPWVGKQAVQAGMTKFVEQMAVKDGGFKTENVMVSGDLAVETGSYEWTLQPKQGKEFHDAGKYLTVWRLQPDGSWKIVRDINNTNLPAM